MVDGCGSLVVGCWLLVVGWNADGYHVFSSNTINNQQPTTANHQPPKTEVRLVLW